MKGTAPVVTVETVVSIKKYYSTQIMSHHIREMVNAPMNSKVWLDYAHDSGDELFGVIHVDWEETSEGTDNE